MRTVFWSELGVAERHEVLRRPTAAVDESVWSRALEIVESVRLGGDAAVRDWTRRLDGVELGSLRILGESVSVSAELESALELAAANIRAFHAAQTPASVRVETMPGLECEMRWVPIRRVGLYVPGGTAPLCSTVLMLAIPALLAGCGSVAVVTPPQKGGGVDPAVLAACRVAGVDEIYVMGGAQAVAALAFGTESVPKVDKIFGPGNAYVTAAKQIVAQRSDGAALDLPAGPTEVMVVADSAQDPVWVAADLLAQAEHDVLSDVVLVTDTAEFGQRVEMECARQLADLPRRSIAAAAMKNSRVVVVDEWSAALDVIEGYGPEHLLLQGIGPESLAGEVRSAGSVFLGRFTPESLGDYAAGTNHVLPTAGAAMAYGGVSLMSFLRSMTMQRATESALGAIGGAVMELARAEQLEGHARAVEVRTVKVWTR